MTDSLSIRDATLDDRSTLEAMLFEAFFWRPRQARPTLERFRPNPEFQKWMRGFGTRTGDRAVVAERDGRSVGAAFYRLFTDAEHSYGYVDARTPEVGIGVAADARGAGVGRRLLQALIARAAEDGVSRLSLSVEPDNFAMHLYEGVGFRRTGPLDGAWTMTCEVGTGAGTSESDGRGA